MWVIIGFMVQGRVRIRVRVSFGFGFGFEVRININLTCMLLEQLPGNCSFIMSTAFPKNAANENAALSKG